MKTKTETLGDRIYLARHRKRWSQTELSEAMGVHQAKVSRWETGLSTPNVKEAQLLAELLDVKFDVLVLGQSA